MRVLWLTSGLFPEACDRLGYEQSNGCGWLSSMLAALQGVVPDADFCMVGIDSRSCDVQVGRVRHISIPSRFTYDRVPVEIENRIRGIIQGFNPDVIHVQGTEYYYGCMSPSVYCGRPVVVSIQGVLSGIWPAVAGGLTWRDVWSAHLNARFFLKGQTLFKERDFWRYNRAAQEAKVFRQQVNFIGRTDWDHAWVDYYHPGARYFHVDENLRAPFFSARRELSKIVPHTIFCGASASCALKGMHWLLYAAASLKSDYPDIQIRIAAADQFFVPPKTLHDRLYAQAYHAYLRQLVRKLGLEKNIVALPTLTAEEVAQELCRAELYVLPSLCENSPNSLCEAMLVGTPSVATFVGGVSSMLRDGVEGLLVPSGDPAALAGAIRHVFCHPEEAEKRAVQARQHALTRHDAARNARATWAVYEELVKNHA